MSTAHAVHVRIPRLLGIVLGSLLAVAAVLGATVMLAVALAMGVIGGIVRQWRARQSGSPGSDQPGDDANATIPVEYSVVREPQRGGRLPESGDLPTKASKELS